VHDIADLERRGIPGVFVASTEFIEAAEAQARALGFPAAAVYVPHPIQDRTDEEMRDLADGAVDAIIATLVSARGSGVR
jgi:superfamily II DNA/RNA helicase